MCPFLFCPILCPPGREKCPWERRRRGKGRADKKREGLRPPDSIIYCASGPAEPYSSAGDWDAVFITLVAVRMLPCPSLKRTVTVSPVFRITASGCTAAEMV